MPLIVIFTVFTAGCWDQRLLKESRLVYGSGFDLTEDGKIYTSSVIRDFVNGVPTNAVVHATGDTIRDTRIQMDRKVSGIFQPSKNRVFLLGEKVAKQDIYSFLDVFYREPNSSLSANLGVVKGKASDIIDMKATENTLIAEYLSEIIASEVQVTSIPNVNIQTVCTLMFDEGKDFFIPAFKKKGEEVVLDGTAMFHKRSLTGYLTGEETTLLLIMQGEKAKTARYVTKISSGQKPNKNNYITYSFKKAKSNLKIVSSKPGNVQAEVTVNTKISIVEYPQDHLIDPKVIVKLERKIEEQLTKKAEKTITKIQKANSDLLGIGRELIAYHNADWKQMKWDKEYPDITIIPKFNVEIVGHGIIN
ncbi:Ger(x)C family germination protein [Bacillus ectoiniformans]|uniref:Ger(x)C family spore germination protein n=1 Tax=Bacillus ectoiniformans TaxID=1494429 RepID=UPI00195EC123|nr:Ger(x)C family spore germination protein [Bacillus ectoiniformans]MBM7649105.1 Ger(x)C family germination protein [Bacillus ectoiniformans]